MGDSDRMTSEIDNRADRKPFAAVFGATSLVGRHLVQRLADRGFEGLCLSRRPEPAPYEAPPDFSWGAVSEEESRRVPVSATLFSLTPISALPALLAHTTGGNRLIALSTSSVSYRAQSSDPDERNSARELGRAEKEVRLLCEDRGVAWTIFRPTMIYDPGHDRNVSAIAAFVRRFGVFPIVRPGTGRRQPIHADDVAQAMTAALSAPGARAAILDLPGSETLTYREMVRRIFESLGRRPVLLSLPLGPVRMAFHAWRAVTRAQYSVASLERMNMDLTFDPTAAQKALGITHRPFHPEFLPERMNAWPIRSPRPRA